MSRLISKFGAWENIEFSSTLCNDWKPIDLLDVNNYLKLAKTSKQWPNSYSICNRFDDEFQRLSAKLNETDELPDLSPTPASTTTTTNTNSQSANKAAKQIITAISSFKTKDKFKSKSFIALNQTSPILNNEKKSIESIEKQINYSLRQLEQAKLDGSSRSLSTRDTNNDDTKSFISDENNPSSVYRSRKLKTTLGTGSPSANREASLTSKPQTAKMARVVCSTLTLCDTASATITIPLPNFNNKPKVNATPPRQATPGTNPPVVMQMVRPLDSTTATNTDGSSDRGSASTNSLTRLPDEERMAEVPVGNSSTFNNFLKTVYFKNYNYTRSSTNVNLKSKEKPKSQATPPPSYADLLLINKNNKYYICNNNKPEIVRPSKNDNRFTTVNRHKSSSTQNTLDSPSFLLDSSQFNFLEPSIISGLGVLNTRPYVNKFAASENSVKELSTNPVAAPPTTARRTSAVMANSGNLFIARQPPGSYEDESLFDNDSSISISGKSYKMPESIDKSSIKMFNTNSFTRSNTQSKLKKDINFKDVQFKLNEMGSKIGIKVRFD